MNIAFNSEQCSLPIRLMGLLCLLLFPLAVFADEELPRLGEASLFNLEQEKKLGKQFYQELKRLNLIEENEFLDQYINDLGALLLSGLANRNRDYRFFIVKDSEINAFALPGGYIGVNVGLILRSKSVHQLASVLAHEIAHVRLMHGIQLMKRAKEVNETAMLSILAAILLGSVSGEAGSALLYGGVAGSQQSMVNYTRDFEYEADRLGISLLQAAGFDPGGMVEFFETLEKESSGAGAVTIEYLRTHPVNANRIAEIRNRIDASADINQKGNIYSRFVGYLGSRFIIDSAEPEDAFAQALTLTGKRQYREADEVLVKLYNKDPEDIWVSHSYAENLRNMGHYSESVSIYRGLLRIYPRNYALSLQLVDSLKLAGQLNLALEFAIEIKNQFSDSPAIYARLTELYELLQDKNLQKQSEAEYHRLSGNPRRAIELYDEVLESSNIDLSTRSRIEERRDQVRNQLQPQ
ncbi:MAG: putative Zn-dependent protease [Gammaproteobacteria bacterium]